MFPDKRKAQIIVVAAFLCGVIAGGAGQYLLFQKTVLHPASSAAETLDEMTGAVKLTSTQRAEIEKILDDARQQSQELRASLRPQYDRIRNTTRARIRALLLPEQQALYEEWTLKQDAKRAAKNPSTHTTK